jgi:hypothetical protein
MVDKGSFFIHTTDVTSTIFLHSDILNQTITNLQLSAMTLPLTFRVEFEFALAYVPDDSIPLPHPDDTQKILRFKPTDEDWAQNKYGAIRDIPPESDKAFCEKIIQEQIKDAGFPVSDDKAPLDECDVSKWEIVEDPTVHGPEDTLYKWTDIETRSPAVYFTSGSLEAVADVCNLSNKTYGLHVNDTMGLHVQ